MNDLGGLSQCMMDGDPSAIGRAKRLRRKALIASTLLEVAGIAGMLLWPLITPAVLPPQMFLAPVPIFHSPRNSNPARPHEAERHDRRSTNIIPPIFQQPPTIPQHIITSAGPEPPNPYESVGPAMPDGPGAGMQGDGTEATHIARPDANSHSSAPFLISKLMDASLIYRVEPEYPPTAKMIHLSGTVKLRAIIATDGTVQDAEVVSGNPILARSALAAVRQWRYRPTQLSGKPVEVETLITVQFVMQQ